MTDNERVITDKKIKSNNFEFKSNNEEFNSNKCIEEMACDMCGYIHICNEPFKPISTCWALGCAEKAYAKGYRKERQGHWFIREYEFFTCSECGHDYWNSCDCTKEAKERLAEGDTPNYCPNCGSKMKGE